MESIPTSEAVEGAPGSAQKFEGISLWSFLSALAFASIAFLVQVLLFLLLRNKLARIFRPKTFLVPERERTEPPPASPLGILRALIIFDDREVIRKCGLDAYFFLRYLKTLLVMFVPIACVAIPVLVPLNYMGGRGHGVVANSEKGQEEFRNTARQVTGLDTLAWSNIKPENSGRYTAHLILALLVIIWVCTVFFIELKVYIKVRHDYLSSAEYRLRASATTVLVNSIPKKWLSEDALRGLFDVFPGGVRNVWLNRDLTGLLEKIHEREKVHLMLENAETELIKMAKRKQARKGGKETPRISTGINEAHRLAEGEQGMSSREMHQRAWRYGEKKRSRPASKDILGGGLAKLGPGLASGLGKAYRGFQYIKKNVENALETTNGFVLPLSADKNNILPCASRQCVQIGRGITSMPVYARVRADSTQNQDTLGVSAIAMNSNTGKQGREASTPCGNTVREVTNTEDMCVQHKVRFWQFWKPPAGGYISPIPQQAKENTLPFVPEGKKNPDLIKYPLWRKDIYKG